MKRFLQKLGWFAVPWLGLLTLLFAIPLDKQFGYHKMLPSCDRGDWLYHRIYNNPRNIDVAFIGSSHTNLAVNDSLLEQLTSDGRHYTNLGFCRLGRTLHYALIKDLLQHHQPEWVILEVRHQENRFSHPDYPHIADVADLLNPSPFFNQSYIGDLYQAALTRLDCWRTKLSFQDSIYGTEKTSKNYGWVHTVNQAKKEHLADFKNRRKNAATSIPDGGLEKSEYALSYHYSKKWLKKIQQYLKEQKVKLAFIYIPAYGLPMERPLELEFYQGLAPVLVPPAEIFDNQQHWADHEHLNERGAEALTLWLSANLDLES